jgi:hypothetical protein
VHQLVADGGPILRRYQDVEIANRVASPPIAAGDCDASTVAEEAN